MSKLFTAEWVSPKHPDKMCDRISDAILDECLRQDPDSRVAVETMGGHGEVTITGEITSKAQLTHGLIEMIVARIAGDNLNVTVNLVQQSLEIAQGVDVGGAGDQGIMVGFATRDTEEYMPRAYHYARELGRYIYSHHPVDGKTQITVDEEGLIRVALASFQGVSAERLKGYIEHMYPVVGEVLANTAGDWNIGGFDADAGVTGRKIVVDAYGPTVCVGGGAFSGKDASKVDRSAAYMARKVALEQLEALGAYEVTVRVAYAIGRALPVEVTVNGENRPDLYERFVPANIIAELNLKTPMFEELATRGHFGSHTLWG